MDRVTVYYWKVGEPGMNLHVALVWIMCGGECLLVAGVGYVLTGLIMAQQSPPSSYSLAFR